MKKHMIERSRHFLFTMSVLYLSFILALSVCNYYQSFLIIFLADVISFLILSHINISLEPSELSFSHSKKLVCPLWFFAIIVFFSVIWWLAFYPGDFNLDAYGQWDQAHGIAPFSDWHPIISTLWIKAVISIYDSMPFYIFSQILLFSVSCTAMLQTLQHYGVSPYFCLFTAFLIGINPAVGLNTIAVTKDAQFTIVAVLLFTCFLSIYCTDGKWFEKRANTIKLGLLSALILLVRHNGVFLVIPAVVLLLLLYRSYIKRITEFLLLTLLLFIFVKIPFSNSLHVSPHEDPIGESIGVPMGIMANALVHDYEHIPEDVRLLLLDIAPEQEWIEHYYIGEWDSCKWIFDSSRRLRNESFSSILVLTGKTIMACPQAAYESFRENTRIVWSVFNTNSSWVPEIYVSDNDYGIINKPVRLFQTIADLIIRFSLLPGISFIFWNTGFVIGIIIVFFGIYRSRLNLKLSFLTLPFLIFWLGTMLLLAGPNYRYFYLAAVLFFPLISVMLHPQKKRMTL